MITTDKKLIMLIGKTHSGKTTFAKELKKKIKNLIVLEADPIAIFMKENFPELRESDDIEHTGIFKNVSLKYKTFLLFLEFALALNRPIILSNSNMWSNGRKMVLKLCKKFGYKIIGVYFDFSEEFLIQRVQNGNRSTNVLRKSKNFNELIFNQRARMQIPKSSEFYKFMTIKSEYDLKTIKNNLINEVN